MGVIIGQYAKGCLVKFILHHTKIATLCMYYNKNKWKLTACPVYPRTNIVNEVFNCYNERHSPILSVACWKIHLLPVHHNQI